MNLQFYDFIVVIFAQSDDFVLAEFLIELQSDGAMWLI